MGSVVGTDEGSNDGDMYIFDGSKVGRRLGLAVGNTVGTGVSLPGK